MNKQNMLDTRIKGWIIDLLPIFIIGMPLILFSLLTKLYDNLIFMNFVISVIYCYIICKDLPAGQSYGKFENNMKIVTIDNNYPTSIQLISRNIILLFILPIEIIVTLISPEKRIGDILCRTKVIINDDIKNNRWYLQKSKISMVFIIFICVFLICYITSKIIYESSNLMKLFYS